MDVRAQNTNSFFTSEIKLSQETVNLLNSSLSKTGLAILKSLHFQPHQQQKVLAANVQTSVTSLSNIINRLESIRPPVLVSERIGRAKYYSLTPLAEKYISQALFNNTPSNIRPFYVHSSEQLLGDATIQILYRFQLLAGTEWQLLLDNFLVGISDNENDQLAEIFNEFMSNLKKIRIQQNEGVLYKIYDLLGQGLIVKRIESLLQNELKKPLALEPLFQLERQSIQNAIALIDNIFYEIEPKVFIFDKKQVHLFNTNISDEQYSKIFYTIFRMSQEVDHLNGDKQIAIDSWTKEYYSNNFSLVYIAEKCCNLYKFRRLVPPT